MAISSGLGSSALLPAGLGFRNKIINGGMDVWQRGTTITITSSSGTSFIADRWNSYNNGSGSLTISQQANTSTISGNEPNYWMRMAQTTTGTSTAWLTSQRIEDVRTCAGQTVTVSFYAKADATRTPTLTVEQNFGSGGSSTVTALSVTPSFSTSWQRFVYTFVMPSVIGKTIGSSSYVNVQLGFSSVVQTIDFWGVQLEQNYQPTPFEQRPIGVELALCQRYYETSGTVGAGGGNSYWPMAYTGSVYRSGTVYYKVVKRTSTPTVSITAFSDALVASGLDWRSDVGFGGYVQVSATGNYGGISSFIASAEL